MIEIKQFLRTETKDTIERRFLDSTGREYLMIQPVRRTPIIDILDDLLGNVPMLFTIVFLSCALGFCYGFKICAEAVGY